MKVTHVAWLNGGHIGVIRDEDQYEGVRFHIKAISNYSYDICAEAHGVAEVARWGNQIKPEIGQAIIDEYGRPYTMDIP